MIRDHSTSASTIDTLPSMDDEVSPRKGQASIVELDQPDGMKTLSKASTADGLKDDSDSDGGVEWSGWLDVDDVDLDLFFAVAASHRSGWSPFSEAEQRERERDLAFERCQRSPSSAPVFASEFDDESFGAVVPKVSFGDVDSFSPIWSRYTTPECPVLTRQESNAEEHQEVLPEGQMIHFSTNVDGVMPTWASEPDSDGEYSAPADLVRRSEVVEARRVKRTCACTLGQLPTALNLQFSGLFGRRQRMNSM